MNELLRYEEMIQQQLADLPLPDENHAWVEMKKLLEDDDDDAIIIPPIRRGCGLWVLLGAIVLIGFAWYYFRPDKWFTGSQQTEKVQKTTGNDERSNSGDHMNTDKSQNNDDSIIKKKGNDRTADSSSFNDSESERTSATTIIKNDSVSKSQIVITDRRKSLRDRGAYSRLHPRQKSSPQNPNVISGGTIISSTDSRKVNGNTPTPDHINEVPAKKDSAYVPPAKNDTARIIAANKDSVTKPNDSTATVKPKEKPPKTYSWGAGLSINQQIPFDGQSAVPYNSLGRKGSLLDYIPSVYLRFYQDNHWFIESEFRYGAPQYTKEITYNIEKNTGPSGNVDTSLQVKKTYYHQIPLSFNYYVLPGLSIGTGIVWNRFNSAVSEKRVTKTNAAGGPDTLVSTAIIEAPEGSDSVFSKSYWQFQFQAQYTWKRLMLGVKYSKGLEPFIKFTLPGGQSQEEKNHSLQIFLRYELWRKKH